MNRIRFHFTKTGLVASLSHLDTIRTLERACRRAQLPLGYSQGFNPRPRLAFGPALPVGTESAAEFFEAEMVTDCAPADAAYHLNRSLPTGIRVVNAWRIGSDVPSLSALIVAAHYHVKLPQGASDGLAPIIHHIMSSQEWIIERRRKDRANVRPLIYRLEIAGDGRLELTLAVGDEGTLRPDDFLAALADECRGCFHPDEAEITRTGVLKRAKEGLHPL